MMRRVVLTLSCFCAGASAQQANPVERAAWLAGCWELRAGARVTMEMWMPPAGGLMLGASRTTAGGVAREFEHLRLSARADTLIYTALPSGQNATEFKAISASNQELVFENRAHDFPQVIRYRRTGADSIVARIEGPGPNNTTRGIDYPMRRASCTTPPAPAPPPDTVMYSAQLSPDGRQLLVVKGQAGNWEVYVMNADGSGSRQLTHDNAVDYQATWSPDGTRIAFVSVRAGHQEIYTMQPDGSELSQLTRGSAHNSEPRWSPDGRSILFRSERAGRPQIYVMNADGSEQRALTNESAGAGGPAWSHDGRKILFASSRNGHGEVHVMNADGTAQSQLTTTAQGHSGLPAWSPDGATIVFWSTRDGNDEVYLMNADGSNVRNLTRHPARDTPLSWSRDGAFIYFRSTRDRAGNDIYRIRSDGSDLSRITTTR
jgi:TolB protein